jgi:hypothetical protein
LKKVDDVHPNVKTNKKTQKRLLVLFNFKKKCEKEKEKKPLNEWKHHNVGMISNLNYKKKPSLHLSFLFLSSSPPSISFFLLFLFPSFPIH